MSTIDELLEDEEFVPRNPRERVLGRHVPIKLVRRPLMIAIPAGYNGTGRTTAWFTMPQKNFKGEHLLLWGITHETRVVHINFAGITVLPINCEPVSAMLYYSNLPPDELQDTIDNGGFGPRLTQQLECPTVSPACTIKLEIEGPVSHAAFIGLVLL
jgi:hypothetical protein